MGCDIEEYIVGREQKFVYGKITGTWKGRVDSSWVRERREELKYHRWEGEKPTKEGREVGDVNTRGKGIGCTRNIPS